MSLVARISPIWRRQKLFIAIFFFAVAGWFALDAIYTWPHSNVRWTAHDRFVQEGHEDQWPAYARSQGWVETPPHKFFGHLDLLTQYVIAGLGTMVGALLLIYWITQKDRTVRVDEEAVYTPAGSRVPFTSIVGVGKKRWDSKGYATVRYQEQGRQRQFVLDDYKFETDITHQILEEIEQRLLARSGGGVEKAA